MTNPSTFMKNYLVGGAVRDEMLGLPVHENDWVVVGATESDLLKQGFIQVGKSFPVFLHPKTKEEYALARTEKKQGHGYYGFDIKAPPTVTLEEDLLRRDLTINAMAKDIDGSIIDPYGGQKDIKLKVLRHVSPAFVEDPLRILRVARFASRLHHLGFTIAEETLSLMRELVRSDELLTLPKERIWLECQKSLTETNPDVFFEVLRSVGALAVLFPELDQLFGVPDKNKSMYIDCGIETMSRLSDYAHIESSPLKRFAVLYQDIGKGETPMFLWPDHPEHAKDGSIIINHLKKTLTVPSDYIFLASKWCLVYEKLIDFETLSAENIDDILLQVDAFRRSDTFIALLSILANSNHPNAEKLVKIWQTLWERCVNIDVQSVILEGHQGKEIQTAMQKRRIDVIKSYKKEI